MRLLFAISLFICFPFCKGQTVIDSIINTTWVDDFNVKLQFGSDSILTRSGYQVNQPKFFINDTVIAYQYVPNTDWHQVRYEYYKDSLILRSKDLDFLWFRDCYFGRGLKKNSDNHRWVYYSENYVKNKSLGFEKIQIIGNGFWEVDSAGNIFCNIINRDDLYGHYRGELSEQQLQEFLDLIDREQLKIKKLACRSSSSYGTRHTIRYRSNSKTYETSHCLGYLREMGFETFDFILDNVDVEKLQFQNYADGDSVTGVVVMPLRHRQSHLYQINPAYLGQYEEEGEKYYLYKSFVDSVCFPRDSFTLSNYADKLIYFYSDILLNSQARLLVETEGVQSHWFSRGRAFQRPQGIIFLRLISYKEFPDDYKLVVRSSYRDRVWDFGRVYGYGYGGRENEFFPNPFPPPYRTRFGLPYPFLRPDFQEAFEEYVLPDWEEYLKNQKSEE